MANTSLSMDVHQSPDSSLVNTFHPYRPSGEGHPSLSSSQFAAFDSIYKAYQNAYGPSPVPAGMFGHQPYRYLSSSLQPRNKMQKNGIFFDSSYYIDADFWCFLDKFLIPRPVICCSTTHVHFDSPIKCSSQNRAGFSVLKKTITSNSKLLVVLTLFLFHLFWLINFVTSMKWK